MWLKRIIIDEELPISSPKQKEKDNAMRLIFFKWKNARNKYDACKRKLKSQWWMQPTAVRVTSDRIYSSGGKVQTRSRNCF